MIRYSNILVAGLVWTNASFCGPEDVTAFLNAVQPRQVVASSVVNPACEVARRQAGLFTRNDDAVQTFLHVLVPARQVAEDGSIYPKGSEREDVGDR